MHSLKELKKLRDDLLGANSKRIEIWRDDDDLYNIKIDGALWGSSYESDEIATVLRNITKGMQMSLIAIKAIMDDPKYSMRGALEEINKIIKESGV